jgi:hypothetical protein
MPVPRADRTLEGAEAIVYREVDEEVISRLDCIDTDGAGLEVKEVHELAEEALKKWEEYQICLERSKYTPEQARVYYNERVAEHATVGHAACTPSFGLVIEELEEIRAGRKVRGKRERGEVWKPSWVTREDVC